MSAPYDDGDMGRDHALDDRLTEEILRGRPDAVPSDHRGVAQALAAIRHAATATATPRPSDELRAVFEHGVEEGAAHEVPAAAAAPSRTTPALLRRGRLALRGPVAKVAGLSLLMKVTLGGMAVAAAGVGGAGAAGFLPGQGGTEPAEEADVGREIADDAIEEGGVDGEEVAERVREPGGQPTGGQPTDAPVLPGEAEEPGEDGREQADEHADDRADDGLEEAEQRTGEAPTADQREQAPDEPPRTDGRDEPDQRGGHADEDDRRGDDAPDGEASPSRSREAPGDAEGPEATPDTAEDGGEHDAASHAPTSSTGTAESEQADLGAEPAETRRR